MRICKIKGCTDKYKGYGYCNKHYRRWLRYGDPLYLKQEQHGMRYTSEYKTWQAMKDRCYNKNNPRYKNWGGNGIIICDKWRNSFIAFFKDMGPKPFSKAQIDRKNNDGNYTPENCHWTTCKENNRNRNCVKLTMEKANEIRKLYAIGNITHVTLGLIYNVSANLIWYVIHNKIWI